MLSAQRRTTPRLKEDNAAFPSRQLLVLALCRICEPIAFMSIFPYIYYMIESFHITNDESRIAFYAGMVTSAFALAEFATGALWGRLSDVVGRKPVLLCGLAGTGISMVAFGFAPNLPTALIARALGGLLNGNIGVLQTTVAEVVTVEAHRPRAYSIMPFVWCLGSIIGSGLGGTLANSAKSYPAVFQQGSIFERFPYLLPNMVCAVVVILSLLVGILFLEETLEDKKSRRDVGLACGRWIVSCFGRTVPHCSIGSSKQNYLDQTLALLDEDDLVLAYDSSEKSQCFACCNPVQPDPPAYRIHATQAITYSASVNAELPEQTVNTVSDVSLEKEEHGGTFTYQVVLNIVSFGILAYHTICAEQLLPVLLAMNKSSTKPVLPFKFLGGFELSSRSIGFLLSAQGLFQMVVQIFLFPVISRRLGSLRTFRYTVMSYPFLYFIIPYLTVLPEGLRMICIYPVLLWKVTAQALSYPSNAMMLAEMAPSRKVLGTINGVAASAASLSRAFGPTLSGLIQAAGLGLGCLGLPWWITGGVAVLGAGLTLIMVEVSPRKISASIEEPRTVCNSCGHVSGSGHDMNAYYKK